VHEGQTEYTCFENRSALSYQADSRRFHIRFSNICFVIIVQFSILVGKGLTIYRERLGNI
jgi:hypothetical protein